MPETIVLGKILNSGMSFTSKTNNNLVKMFYYAESSGQHINSYAELQVLFENNCGVTASNVRMYSPFFYSQGLINEYKRENYDISDYFTPVGKAYAKALDIASKIDDEKAKEKTHAIIQGILTLGMYERKRKNTLDYYFDFLKLCTKYRKTNLYEFNYMLYYKEKFPESDYIVDIESTINEIRNNKKEYIFLQNRTTKAGQKITDAFPDNTFNYTRNLLLECGLIVEGDDKYYHIPEAMVSIVTDLLEVN